MRIIKSIELSQIELNGEIGRRISSVIRDNIFKIDHERDFLEPFRHREISPWTFNGIGMHIEALVLLSAFTADPELLALKDHMIGELLETQEPDGYIGIFPPGKRLDTAWDITEISYIIKGLCAEYEYFNDRRSLEAARGLGDYIILGWSGVNEEYQESFSLYTVGLESAMVLLSKYTGDERYVSFCIGKRSLLNLDKPIVLGRTDSVDGHVYAFTSRCDAQLTYYETNPDEGLLRLTRKAFDFLFNNDAITLPGLSGEYECWHVTQEGLAGLGETCATAYLLRCLRRMDEIEPDVFYGDVMERTIYNGLFAAQTPDGRSIRYYTSFEGGRSIFETDIYCCPNNFRRIMGELPRMVWFTTENGIYANLYETSGLKFKTTAGDDAFVRQETRYPSDGKVAFIFELKETASFEFCLRIPKWSENPFAMVNGDPINEMSTPGEFLRITRTWKNGDCVELDLNMKYRLVRGRKAQCGRAALMFGPTVLGLNKSRNMSVDSIYLMNLTLDTSSIDGPYPFDGIRPDGISFKVRCWSPGRYYPAVKPDLELVLTEFTDTDCELIYFKIPDPTDPSLVDDELFSGPLE